ncbi:MAG: reverse transcriptase domain-containing protein [Sphingomonadales bacterium]
MGYAPQNLIYLTSQSDDLYSEISIKKRSSDKLRKICIPSRELMGVQKSILNELVCHHPVSAFAYAYVRGKSAVDAAKRISGGGALLRLDVANFFPSISMHRVYGLFRSLGYNKKVSYILSELTTYKGSLCQGAPTSPYISNLVCVGLDKYLSKKASYWGLKYLRYSDDMYFYGERDFKHKIFSDQVAVILRNSSFRLNNSKTKYFPLGQQRVILGLNILGKDPEFTRETRRKYRAAFHNAARNISWARDNMNKLRGMAGWYKLIYGEDQNYREYRTIIMNVALIKMHEPYLVG